MKRRAKFHNLSMARGWCKLAELRGYLTRMHFVGSVIYCERW